VLKLGMKNKDKIVILLLKCSIPSDTSQIGWNENLVKWMVLDGMGSITLHSIPFLIYKTKQWNMVPSHSIPFHSITLHQSKHSLKMSISLSFNVILMGWLPHSKG
jgi:hypothetical protein